MNPMNPRDYHTPPQPVSTRARRPVCHEEVYSRADIHPLLDDLMGQDQIVAPAGDQHDPGPYRFAADLDPVGRQAEIRLPDIEDLARDVAAVP